MSDAGTCPALRTGDRMVYAHPSIESERTCGQALATLAPAAEDVARATAEGRPMAPLTLYCPVEGCGAVFVLRAIERDEPVEIGRARRAAPPGDGGPSSDRNRRASRAPSGGKLRIVAWVLASLLILALLAVGGAAGVVFFRPDIVPPPVMTQLKAWGIPLPEEPPPQPAKATRSE